MSDLFNLPHLDEDGYFDGFTACQNDKDGQPLLPPDVVNTKAPADDPKTADAYYKWDAEGKKWLAEKKPTTAARMRSPRPGRSLQADRPHERPARSLSEARRS